jgi:myosin heavy subunit
LLAAPARCSPPPPPTRAGYQYRRHYAAFLDNFWQLLPSVRDGSAPAQERATSLLQRAGISDFKLGTTKVFLR